MRRAGQFCAPLVAAVCAGCASPSVEIGEDLKAGRPYELKVIVAPLRIGAGSTVAIIERNRDTIAGMGRPYSSYGPGALELGLLTREYLDRGTNQEGTALLRKVDPSEEVPKIIGREVSQTLRAALKEKGAVPVAEDQQAAISITVRVEFVVFNNGGPVGGIYRPITAVKCLLTKAQSKSMSSLTVYADSIRDANIRGVNELSDLAAVELAWPQVVSTAAGMVHESAMIIASGVLLEQAMPANRWWDIVRAGPDFVPGGER